MSKPYVLLHPLDAPEGRDVHHADAWVRVRALDLEPGRGLASHASPSPVVVEVVSGAVDVIVDDERLALRPGSWLRIAPGTRHAVEPVEPARLLVTVLVEPGGLAAI